MLIGRTKSFKFAQFIARKAERSFIETKRFKGEAWFYVYSL